MAAIRIRAKEVNSGSTLPTEDIIVMWVHRRLANAGWQRIGVWRRRQIQSSTQDDFQVPR